MSNEIELVTPKGHEDAKARIAACVREIEIICDTFGYDPNEFLAEKAGESFADHPVSVAELRSDRSGLGRDWTPRDALIEMLRGIDAGKLQVDQLIICWAEKQSEEDYKEGAQNTHYSSASKSPMEAMGLLALTMRKYGIR